MLRTRSSKTISRDRDLKKRLSQGTGVLVAPSISQPKMVKPPKILGDLYLTIRKLPNNENRIATFGG
jgi:hypothetical protein